MNVKCFCVFLLWCITRLGISDTLFFQQQALTTGGISVLITTRLLPVQNNDSNPVTRPGRLQLFPSQSVQVVTLCGEFVGTYGLQLIRIDSVASTYLVTGHYAEIRYNQLNSCPPSHNAPYNFGFAYSAQAFVVIKKEQQKDSVVPRHTEPGLIYSGGGKIVDNKPGDDFYRIPFIFTNSNWLVDILPTLFDTEWLRQLFEDPATFLPALIVTIQPPEGTTPIKISINSNQIPHLLNYLGDINQLLRWLINLIPGRQNYYIDYLLELSDHLINTEYFNHEFLSFLREQVEYLVQKSLDHNELQLVISWSDQHIDRFNAERATYSDERRLKETIVLSERSWPKPRLKSDSFMETIRNLKTLGENTFYPQILTVMPLGKRLGVQTTVSSDGDQIILHTPDSLPLPERATLSARIRQGMVCSFCKKPLCGEITQLLETGQRFHQECFPRYLTRKNKVPSPPTGKKPEESTHQYIARPDKVAEREIKSEMACFSCSACEEKIHDKLVSDFPEAVNHLRNHYLFCSSCDSWLYFRHTVDADSGFEAHIKHCYSPCRYCDKAFNMEEYAAHKKTCPKIIVTCSSCKKDFYRYEFVNHIYQDSKQHFFMKCPFGDCKVTKGIPGTQLEQHIDKFHTQTGATNVIPADTAPSEIIKTACGCCMDSTTYSLDKILKHTFKHHPHLYRELLIKAKDSTKSRPGSFEEIMLSLLRQQYEKLQPSDEQP